MKTSQKFATIMAAAFLAVFFMFNSAVQAQQAKAKAWPVPDKYKAMKAPAKADVATGKELWAKHCKSCHGSKGLGDGPKAAALKTFSGDFSSAAFQAGTDGELFYRTNKGRDEMPGYEKKIPDANDRWALVAYMRTMKK
jgi:mono/diheme cytochrome c family protein